MIVRRIGLDSLKCYFFFYFCICAVFLLQFAYFIFLVSSMIVFLSFCFFVYLSITHLQWQSKNLNEVIVVHWFNGWDFLLPTCFKHVVKNLVSSKCHFYLIVGKFLKTAGKLQRRNINITRQNRMNIIKSNTVKGEMRNNS